ncbi:hypothetical protein DEO72_LG9g2118 [Vigna unguiculata]|uniref:Uncharacterized protein n=1 Tax=Vigna unguiculata TaxID=3917 RepID=A0A4D6N2B9_VIGUN|nr:hypothetical protein DEO72_LG9g2118 [Vigna unguiculata]
MNNNENAMTTRSLIYGHGKDLFANYAHLALTTYNESHFRRRCERIRSGTPRGNLRVRVCTTPKREEARNLDMNLLRFVAI